ncbi:MAG: class I SAM-dependent methyltransferase [Opitutaceae bacterium]|nr:class I SAM-dependent methyltransferase [Opitutaceae bacterium]
MGFSAVLDHASLRFRPCGRAAYHFARGKLRGDPVYRAVLEGGLLPRDGTVLDLGCGGGLMLAVLASARGLAPADASPARRLVGVETRPQAAAIARRALGPDAEIVTDDVRLRPLPAARAILLFDVLNLMPAADQDTLLAAVQAALEPGGVLLVREADAAAGWRFRAVRAGNWIKACWIGRFAQPFHYRPLTEWRGWLERAGLEVEVRPMGMGTPFGNVLLVGRKAGERGRPRPPR